MKDRNKRSRWMGETMVLAGIIVLVALSGCGSKSQTEIEEGLSNFTSLYPTKDLMSFFDKEGFRDDNFEEGDKGVWYVQTYMSENNKDFLYTEGMTLNINRNTGEAKGIYTLRDTYDDFNKNQTTTYNVTFQSGEYKIIEKVDNNLKEKIENFQFLVQYVDLQPTYLSEQKVTRKMYNPEVPMYEMNYELRKSDENIQQILAHYPEFKIHVDEKPLLRIKGKGNLAGSAVGTRNMEIKLEKEKNIYVTSSVIYVPDKEYGDEG